MKNFDVNIDTLIRWLTNRVNKIEIEQITEWFEEDPNRKNDFLILQKVAQDYIKTDPHKRAKASWEAFKAKIDDNPMPRPHKSWHQQKPLKRVVWSTLKIAAVFLLLCLGGIVGYNYLFRDLLNLEVAKNKQAIVIEAERVHQKKIALSDGSLVLLAPGSSIKIPRNFNDQRSLYLEGEAFFEVALMESSKFVVQTSKSKTEVLGTKFNLESWPNAEFAKVAVLEGSVCFKTFMTTPNNNSVIVNAGQICIGFEGQPLQPPRLANIYKIISWKNGDLSFYRSLLSDVLYKLECFYDVDFNANLEEDILSHRLTATFAKRDIDELLDHLALLLNVSWMRENKRIFIKNLPIHDNLLDWLKQKSPADIFSFNNTRISIDVKNKNLIDIIDQLAELSSCNINYDYNHLIKYKNFTFRAIDSPLNDVLTRLLRDTEISYFITGQNAVSLTSRDVTALITATINGRIYDQVTRCPIQNVIVSIQGTSYSSITNKYGYFELSGLFPGKYNIMVIYNGKPTINQPFEILKGAIESVDIYL